ncbi:MAG: hypothetical protein WEB31_08315 [Chthoniobacterales bacterium]
MQRPQLVEYAKSQLAKGVPRAAIEAHLRGQNWDEVVIAEVLTAAGSDSPPVPAAVSTGTPARRKFLTVALLLGLLATIWGASQLYRSYSVAKVVREKTKFVEFTGKISGQLEDGKGAEFGLLVFRGQLDSSQIDTPKAALQVTFDPNAPLGDISPQTDARLLALTLFSIGAGAQTIGGVDVRLADWNTYLRPARMPFAGDQSAAAVGGLVTALLGPNILTDFWVKIPARAGGEETAGAMISNESKATWGLLFRPTEKIFGESKELRFQGKERGGEINGMPTDIHRYAIDGPWLTKQLVKALREAEVDDKLDMIAMLQDLVLGPDAGKVTASLDSLEISDGELAVWVGRGDTLPYRMDIRLGAKEGSSAPLSLRLSGGMEIAYAEPAAIEIPAQAINLKQLQEQIGMLQGLGNLFR